MTDIKKNGTLKSDGAGLDPGLFLTAMALPPLVNYLTFLSLSLFICEIRAGMVPSL